MTFERDFETLCEAFIRSSETGDARACAAHYTDDGEIWLASGEVIRGHEALTAFFNTGPERLELTTVWSESSGDVGNCIQQGKGNSDFTCMLALRREADGSWKVSREFIFPA
jgi:ketosteroid isomerase-like protein